MANPFNKITSNAEKTKKKWDSETTETPVDAKQCNTCGAPRPVKSNLTTCAYCGSLFMTINANIKSDTE